MKKISKRQFIFVGNAVRDSQSQLQDISGMLQRQNGANNVRFGRIAKKKGRIRNRS